MFGAQAIDAFRPLQNPGGVPGQIIVDQDICLMQVNALGQHVRGYE